ncbi:MAG TPA: hypothetical protein PLW22_07920 [Tenuifilum sp.]|uniref:hypothetical protein n=2 Tax=Tenuifilum sp. TaxID=2760880 RepID=UPI001B5A2557|nr:hypothetical protein [Bacteroidales bacterium]HOK86518.1 hypothetical protein [Tenuifilum sp.]MBP9030076.1 hypothetical protein [Bacteroidales bacterium]HON70496.1 hypothetical protein [Tenuifilum sp.]HOU74670.1 hypothetical protein [Tenuifilum sp.]
MIVENISIIIYISTKYSPYSMRRAKIYLAIVAYFTLVKRFLSKPLYRFVMRIKQKLGIKSVTRCSYDGRVLPAGFEFFFNGGSHLNLGLEQGFLNQYLRN